MTDQYHVNGELVPADEATVNVRDRGFMYGDGAFETLRIYAGEPFEWDAHAERLQRSCETLGFGDALPPASDLRERVDETLAANDLFDSYLKLSVTRGVQPGKLTPGEDVDPTIVIYVSELPRAGVDGERVWDGPASVGTVERERVSDEAIPADAKTHNYLNGILARLELRNSDHDEAIMCSSDGYLAEGATSNLFFVSGGTLRTPTAALPLLPGITRDVVLSLAEEAGISVETGRYDPEILRQASEVFVTNSTWEIRPVTRVDDEPVAVGPVTRDLQERFDKLVESFY
ncbi:aminotransferase class IV [Halobacteriaceae archaeon SHR40]|uniref:aminotransferase class IV n=1 Tax=Halovenus amylolytica TaxID=2500550 RepID=UPI000FE2FB59